MFTTEQNLSAGGPNNPTTGTNAVLGDTWFDTANTRFTFTMDPFTLIGPQQLLVWCYTGCSEIGEDDTGVNPSILETSCQ